MHTDVVVHGDPHLGIVTPKLGKERLAHGGFMFSSSFHHSTNMTDTHGHCRLERRGQYRGAVNIISSFATELHPSPAKDPVSPAWVWAQDTELV